MPQFNLSFNILKNFFGEIKITFKVIIFNYIYLNIIYEKEKNQKSNYKKTFKKGFI
jgi:hypothetical protein